MLAIRRIHLHEGPLYRRMRLLALSDSPEAFATTFESASRRSSLSWKQQAESGAIGPDRVILLAFVDDEPAGMAALYRDALHPESGELIQFWVDSAHRGFGVAGQLMEEIFAWATLHHFERICAWINRGNDRALRFYQKYGFEPTGETQSFREGSDLVSGLLTKSLAL